MKLGETKNNVISENTSRKTLDSGIKCSEDDASWLLSRKNPLVGIWKDGKMATNGKAQKGYKSRINILI